MEKGTYFVKPGLGNVAGGNGVSAEVQHFPGDVGIGPTSPPQGIADQQLTSSPVDWGHGGRQITSQDDAVL